MRWLHERFSRTSDKNGAITCERWFGEWTVTVDGYSQSGNFNTRMFKDAFGRLPPSVLKRALVLGLGGGCVIEPLHKKFPGVEVTVIEWDPVMVEIAQRIQMFEPRHAPEIFLGDALEILPSLNRSFDFIIFDLYTGPDIAPMVFLPPFFSALQNVSHAKTLILLNAFRSRELFPIWDRAFFKWDQWRFEYNLLGLYAPKRP